jgi:hypothetical protein
LTGGVTLTVAAVKVVAEVELPLGPVANTQSPALIALAVVATVSVKDVEELHETATWPACWLWTSIDEPDTVAIRPDAAGAFAPPALPPPAPPPAPPAAAPLAAAAELGWLDPLLEDPPPQPARARVASATPVTASIVERARGFINWRISIRPSVLGENASVLRENASVLGETLVY